ncbi:MAG: DUF1566 domain-containing protein [Candidatus Omnitrophica bacterium]|nr:DUF1566 domain-containing protein [Candidatus Omnitrophota bacterium]
MPKQVNFLDKLKSPKRFKKLKDGWIRDKVLDLDWGPSSTTTMTWKDAEKYCKDQGGRLPELQELQALVDYSKRFPAINSIFSDIKTDDYYWSATLGAGFPGFAWYVSFYYGSVDYWNEDYNIYVRPCRSSQ